MKQKTIVLLLFLFALGLATTAQKLSHDAKKQIEVLTPQADFLYSEQNYYRALPLYLKLIQLDSTQDYYWNQAGICYIFTDEKSKAIPSLRKVYADAPEATDILYFLGRAYHVNYQFDTAIMYFNKYLATNPAEDKKQSAKNYIDYCNNAKDLIAHQVKVKITNLGPSVNTAASEYAPVITADESEIIYTYRGPESTGGLENIKFKTDTNGEYYEDIFITQKVGLNWITPEKVSDLDTKSNDAGIALSNDGQVLFSFRSTPQDGGDIFMSKLDGASWSKPERLGPNINTKYWEGSCSLSSDGRTLYFTSERPGGFGGRDIYYSRIQKDGTWGTAHNLGANINTPLNDDAPFIHPDGVTLFFSSEGWNSMGGYDIFYSTLNLEDSTWNRPVNLGFPINSPDDDRYYVLSADGTRGYFSSSRKGGYGQEDIYIVTPGYRGSRPVLALTIGVVTVDDKPTRADIKVTDAKTNEDRGTFQSNSNTGKYIIALTPGSKYRIAVEVQGAKPHIEYLDIDSLATFVKVKEDIHLYSDSSKTLHNISVADTTNVLQRKVDQQVTAYKAEQNLDSYRAEVYQRILNNYGSVDSTGVSYNMELGTYQNPNDFDSTKYRGLGKILHRTDASGNTIFYVDSMNTLLDAEILKYKVISRDSNMKKNIVVTVNNQGKRQMMEQFYLDEYKKDKDDFTPDTIVDVIRSNSTPMISLSQQDKRNGKVMLDTNKLVRDNGQVAIDGLSYRLELGAFDDTNDFKLGFLSKYGAIHKEKFPDGTFHYYMGPFKTLAEAQNFKKNLVEKEPDASKSIIMVFYFGKQKPATSHSADSVKRLKKQAVAMKDSTKSSSTTVALNNTSSNPVTQNTATNTASTKDFSALVGKNLNDPSEYHKLMEEAGELAVDSLTFRVQIGAYRHPQNYKYKNLMSLIPPPAVVLPYPDGITRFTLREFKTLKEAEAFRQTVIKKGTKDAWITGMYKGKRMLLQELIAVNFYNNAVN